MRSKDKARLDWMQKNKADAFYCLEDTTDLWTVGSCGMGLSLREAIDAAIKAERRRPGGDR